MWVVTTLGMYSAVAHREQPDTVIVRSRVRRDMENLCDVVGVPRRHVYIDLQADYPVRLDLTRREWAEFLTTTADAIDYDNFKSAVDERQGAARHDVYLRVWQELLALECLPGGGLTIPDRSATITPSPRQLDRDGLQETTTWHKPSKRQRRKAKRRSSRQPREGRASVRLVQGVTDYDGIAIDRFGNTYDADAAYAVDQEDEYLREQAAERNDGPADGSGVTTTTEDYTVTDCKACAEDGGTGAHEAHGPTMQRNGYAFSRPATGLGWKTPRAARRSNPSATAAMFPIGTENPA